MKARLSLLYFLQFSVWGCYLTCLGQFLGAGGLGGNIAWFYAAIGLVSILTPPLFGRIADRHGRPELLLVVCHMAAASLMAVMWRYSTTHPLLEFRILYPLYIAFLAFYMPTMALANTATFGLLSSRGHSSVTSFPGIRIWGTVGFVAAMWFVNSAYWADGKLGFAFSDSADAGHLRFQYNAVQLLCGSAMGFLTALYALSLPRFRKVGGEDYAAVKLPMGESLKKMFGKRLVAVFLIFVILSGCCLQISNGFVTPYITHFSGLSQYAGSLASGNATMLFSVSQISEAVCILLVGLCLKRRGIKFVYALGLLAWFLRFFMLGAGNPGNGLWLLVGSMLVYGLAFNFITIAGHIYIQQEAPQGMKGFAQGLMMLMGNGIGATLGTLTAGGIVNKWCSWQMVKVAGSDQVMRLFMGEWNYPWFIFAGYAFCVLLFWLLFFKSTRREEQQNP